MSFRRVAGNAAASAIQVILTAFALVAMYYLLMQTLTIAQIGLWALVVGSVAVARISELGLGNGVARFVAIDLGADDPQMAARSVGMSVVFVGVLIAIVALIAEPIVYPLLIRVTPAPLHADAKILLDSALVAVVLGGMANVFNNTLLGTQQLTIRSAILVGGNLVQLAATWLVLPRYGLSGMGYVQIAQAVFLLAASAIATYLRLSCRLSAYMHFDWPRLKEMLAYGGGMQVAAIAQLLFEPLTKALLTSFGGLALTGYFDIANRAIQQFRSIIVAAYTALVPHIANRIGQGTMSKDWIRSVYSESTSLLMFLVLPSQAVLAGALPLGLYLWRGSFDPTLLAVALAQLAGWAINLATVPAYLLYTALGRLRWNILGHVLIGAINLAAGYGLGHLAGGAGVITGEVLALIVGSMAIVVAFHHEYAVGWHVLLPARRIPMLLLVCGAIGASGYLAAVPETLPGPAWLAAYAVAIGILTLPLMWFDPSRPMILLRLNSLRGKTA